jgi:serine/threonine protein kinase
VHVQVIGIALPDRAAPCPHGVLSHFLLKDPQRHRHAGLKLFPGHPEQLSAVEVEVACLDRLRNPRIPRILDGYMRNAQYCLFQEWIPRPSLEGSFDYLRKRQRLSELLRQVLDHLSLIHHAGIVHGDFHPGNLIVGKDSGQLFLVDFAIVRSLAGPCAANEGAGRDSAFPTRHLETTQAVGGLARLFFSPQERARFGHIWPGVDLYAHGSTTMWKPWPRLCGWRRRRRLSGGTRYPKI